MVGVQGLPNEVRQDPDRYWRKKQSMMGCGGCCVAAEGRLVEGEGGQAWGSSRRRQVETPAQQEDGG
jgi:hypothetical protein